MRDRCRDRRHRSSLIWARFAISPTNTLSCFRCLWFLYHKYVHIQTIPSPLLPLRLILCFAEESRIEKTSKSYISSRLILPFLSPFYLLFLGGMTVLLITLSCSLLPLVASQFYNDIYSFWKSNNNRIITVFIEQREELTTIQQQATTLGARTQFTLRKIYEYHQQNGWEWEKTNQQIKECLSRLQKQVDTSRATKGE